MKDISRLFTAVSPRALFSLTFLVAGASACAAAGDEPVTERFFEVDPETTLSAPVPSDGDRSSSEDGRIRHGKYLVELLGCSSCHTDGALVGEPRFDRRLAGSRVGIAIDNPLDQPLPGVTYPANLTPDDDTGLGTWTDDEIAAAIRAGTGRDKSRLHAVMPWAAYARISDSDVRDIVAYLKSLAPVHHEVPRTVSAGRPAKEDFVYFGIYQSN